MIKHLALTLSLSLVAFNAAADGITIDPGKWEMNTVVNMPMLNQPKVTTVTECMEKGELSSDSLLEDMKNSNAECTMGAEVLEGNAMKLTMECSQSGAVSTGEWEVTSYGDTMEGDGQMTMSIQGQEIIMTMAWEGKRIGDCD